MRVYLWAADAMRDYIAWDETKSARNAAWRSQVATKWAQNRRKTKINYKENEKREKVHNRTKATCSREGDGKHKKGKKNSTSRVKKRWWHNISCAWRYSLLLFSAFCCILSSLSSPHFPFPFSRAYFFLFFRLHHPIHCCRFEQFVRLSCL